MNQSASRFGLVFALLACAASVSPARSAPPPTGTLALASERGYAGAGEDDELVIEFKKYFRTYKDSATRVEAILALQDHDKPAVVEALLPALKMEDRDVVRAAVRVLARQKSEASSAALYAELATNKDEFVRSGLLQAIEEGKLKGDPAALQTLLTDKSWDVRRRAILALGATGARDSVPSIVALAADTEAAVRCAVLDGLAAMQAPEVVQPGIAALGDAVWQVRSSAIGALGKVRHKDSIGPLIARMAAEEGRLQADISVALNEVTGRNYGVDVVAWQQFWKNYADKFEIPSDAELKKLREQQAARLAEYKKAATTSYHQIETPSRKIMFVIDVSGSMEALVVEKERFQDGGYPSLLRIDIVKTELMRTLESLEDYVEFNIIAFATEAKAWKKDLVKANVINKSAAVDFVRRLEAIGGSSKEDLARAGLTGSANLEAGKTNTYGALMLALSAAGHGIKDKHYGVAVDTVFFLSDGRPSHGEYVDVDDILREVRESNELRKVVIHTIAIGEFQKDFMKRLAEDNGGVFVDLGR